MTELTIKTYHNRTVSSHSLSNIPLPNGYLNPQAKSSFLKSERVFGPLIKEGQKSPSSKSRSAFSITGTALLPMGLPSDFKPFIRSDSF